MAIFEEEVIDYFVIGQGVLTNQHYESIHDYLAFAQDDGDILLHASAIQRLTFTETVRYSYGIANISVNQTLNFQQRDQRIKEGYAYQNLLISQSTTSGGKLWQQVYQTLDFIETLDAPYVHAIYDTLTFTETVNLNYSKPKSIVQTLTFQNLATCYLLTERFIAVPVPAVATPIVSVPDQTTGIITRVQHTVSFVSSIGTLVLPAPDFGNTEEIGETRIQRQSRGGDFIIWRDPMWPTTDEFTMTFSYISADKVLELERFVALTCGKLISFTDHENQTFQGVITTPEVEITNPSRHLEASIKFLYVRDEDA